MIDDKEKKAQQTVRKIFKGFSGTVIPRDDALGKVGLKVFQNNSGPMKNYGLVEYDRDDGQGRKILNIRLTDKGKEVVEQSSATTAMSPDPLTNLDDLGAFVDKFNSRNKYWELKLTPKEVAEHR